MAKQLTIIGGGLAGLTLGIGLRQREVPVVLWEAGVYPRHRVCGEFISGKGLEVLRELGLWERLLKAGARHANTAAMVIGGVFRPHMLPEPAMCVSRFALDDLLAREFQRLGGTLKVGSRFVGTVGGEGMVRATGRCLPTKEQAWVWFGLKGHARNVRLEADLEMHYGANAYVGLCALDAQTVNVCGLFRRRKREPKPGREISEMLQGAPGTLLHRRLSGAAWDEESLCAVAGLSFGALSKPERLPCCVGDVMRMIPPLTGNGMSIAFETAGMALEELTGYAQGKHSWHEAEANMAWKYGEAFGARFFWANLLQRAAFSPLARIFSGCLASQAAFKFCYGKTR